MLLFHSCHQWVHLPKTEKLYRFGSYGSRKLTIMKNEVSRLSSSLTTQWNALQYGEKRYGLERRGGGGGWVGVGGAHHNFERT